ncbi:MAG: hypothetical protein JJU28_15420 [Cyclobacteriaceae bacterium]|nr:hypothetical protein [Cyclobacteriaceae bacterium]
MKKATYIFNFILGLLCLIVSGVTYGQATKEFTDEAPKTTKVRISAYDGIVAIGYVDGGGFSNFTGPNINMTYGHSKFILSALPSLRYKRDNSEPRNSFVTPNLGIGFTYSYKLFAIQLPLYYNAKTASENGQWHIGLGLGMRLNYL